MKEEIEKLKKLKAVAVGIQDPLVPRAIGMALAPATPAPHASSAAGAIVPFQGHAASPATAASAEEVATRAAELDGIGAGLADIICGLARIIKKRGQENKALKRIVSQRAWTQ